MRTALFALLFSTTLHAQETSPRSVEANPAFLSAQYNDEGAGSNLNLNFHQPVGNRGWRINAGLRFHVNRTNYGDGPLYTNQLYTHGVLQHLGLKAGLEKAYRIFPEPYQSELYGFYDMQYAGGSLRSLDPLTQEAITRGPVSYIQNYFGLGLRGALSPRLGLRAFAGAGADLIHEKSNPFGMQIGGGSLTYNFARVLGAGLEYHLH